MTKATIEHLLSLVEFYAETTDGKEDENRRANEQAWKELEKERELMS